MSDDQIQLIELSLIDRPFKISRDTIDPEKVRELAESIREKGLLQPIILRPQNGRYEIVAGDRRFLAHRFLESKMIKAVILDLDDQDTIILRAVENLQRENLTHCEEGRVYALLMEIGGFTQNQIAKKTGKSISTIQNHIKLIGYPDYVQTACDRRLVSLAVAHTLMEIEDADFRKYYFNMAVENGINEKVARLWVDDHFKSKAGTFYDDAGGVPVPDVGGELKPVFVTCEVCHGPTEIKNVRNMMVCRECQKKVRHA
jgi:ParB family chromosome partitioning protein